MSSFSKALIARSCVWLGILNQDGVTSLRALWRDTILTSEAGISEISQGGYNPTKIGLGQVEIGSGAFLILTIRIFEIRMNRKKVWVRSGTSRWMLKPVGMHQGESRSRVNSRLSQFFPIPRFSLTPGIVLILVNWCLQIRRHQIRCCQIRCYQIICLQIRCYQIICHQIIRHQIRCYQIICHTISALCIFNSYLFLQSCFLIPLFYFRNHEVIKHLAYILFWSWNLKT